jgi:hypothetical protein
VLGLGVWLGVVLSGLIEVELLVVAGLFGCFLGGFFGSVPVVVLMVIEKLEGFGGLGEDADGFGATDIDGVGLALPTQNLSDPVDGGFEPDGIPGGGPGNDQL